MKEQISLDMRTAPEMTLQDFQDLERLFRRFMEWEQFIIEGERAAGLPAEEDRYSTLLCAYSIVKDTCERITAAAEAVKEEGR